MKKVRITLPKAVYGMNVTGKINNKDGSMASHAMAPLGGFNEPGVQVNNTLKPTTRENATLEAEKGETVVTNLAQGGIPEFYTVGGKRHSAGGTPLNLPPDSFIFSRDKKLKVKDPDILAQFGQTVKPNNKKGFTFAELSKPYNLNKYRQILEDPNSDNFQIKSAERMIQNYNLKLGGLAMVQESLKGFPNGIPGIATPYLENVGIDPSQLAQMPGQQQEAPQQMRWGGVPRYQDGNEVPVNEADYTTGFNDPTINDASYVNYYGNQPVLDESQYIQSMGYNPIAVDNKKKVRVSYSGTTPVTSGKATKVQNIPKDARKWDVNTDGYDKASVKTGDYIKNKDGVWERVTGRKTGAPEYTGSALDDRLKGDVADLREAYGRLEQRIEGNPELKKAIIAKYKTNIAKAKARKNLSEADLEVARGLDDDAIMKNFYEAQKQIMAVQAHKGELKDNKDIWDKDKNQYINTAKELGFDPLDSAHAGAFQATYIGLQELSKDPKFKNELEDFRVTPVGKGDEPGGGTGLMTISDIDGWVGNTTIGQAALYAPKANELELEEAKWDEAAKEIEHLKMPDDYGDNPFWTEDIINLAGAAKNLWGIKKYQPWNAVPGMKLPSPTFMSPDQQIQNILGTANQGVQGAAAFGSPQAYTANVAQLQNNAMQNVANSIGNVQDKNVQIANQFELQRSQIMNNANARRAQLATNLHDKNTILNQQFDNAKTQAWDQVRQMGVNMWTNRGMTQNLNTFDDQFYIDPRTGYKHFRNPRDLNPKDKQDADLAGQINKLVGQVPGLTPDQAARIVLKEKGIDLSPTGFTGMDPRPLSPSHPGGIPSGYQ